MPDPLLEAADALESADFTDVMGGVPQWLRRRAAALASPVAEPADLEIRVNKELEGWDILGPPGSALIMDDGKPTDEREIIATFYNWVDASDYFRFPPLAEGAFSRAPSQPVAGGEAAECTDCGGSGKTRTSSITGTVPGGNSPLDWQKCQRCNGSGLTPTTPKGDRDAK